VEDFRFGWGDYVSTAEKQRRAQRMIAKLKKQGRPLAPVAIDGRTIAKNFWGKSWCVNLERYSDFASRLPRGRSYVRNGCVVDLQITKGKIVANVCGSDLYDVTIAIAPVVADRWRAICSDCSGTIDSLVELLQGRLAKGVMDRVCREGDGLFPAPAEIELSCSCPDWADMCKHVAATLYGVGARLDEAPQLLFVLRGVDESELLAGAAGSLALSKPGLAADKVLDDSDVAALFGLDMAEGAESEFAAAPVPKSEQTAKRRVPTAAVKTLAKPKVQPPRKRTAMDSTRSTKATARRKRVPRRMKRDPKAAPRSP
jgi:uncharacterized Zn finger protein